MQTPSQADLRPPALVPDVLGMSAEEATATLREAGFRVAVASAAKGSARDPVAAQSPPSGDTAPEGSLVTIEVGE